MLFVTIALPGNAIEGPIESARRLYKNVVEGIEVCLYASLFTYAFISSISVL
jgi:hypothetical protein